MAKRIISVFEILILVTFFSFLAAFVITTNQNATIAEHTEEFVELVRYKGCITRNMYEDFLRGFNTPVAVAISIEKKALLPDAPKNIEMTQEVLDALETSAIYTMKTGDVIQVSVRKLSSTVYDSVIGRAAGYSTSSSPVIATKGGMVLNEQYDKAGVGP